MKDFIAMDLTPWIDNLLKFTIGYDVGSKGMSWFLFAFVCFVIVIGVKKLIVEMLDMTSASNERTRNEVIIGTILLVGLFVYTINTSFANFFDPSAFGNMGMLKSMPTWIPDIVRKALSDPGTPILTGNKFWQVFPFLWTLGPALLMVYMEVQKKFVPIVITKA